MSDHTDTTLTDTERDSLTECECGHYLNEHSSEGCLATAYDGDDGMASDDDVCTCSKSPQAWRLCAIEAIVAERVAAARAERDAMWVERLTALVTAISAKASEYDGCCQSCDDSYAPGIRVGARMLRALIEEAPDA